MTRLQELREMYPPEVIELIRQTREAKEAAYGPPPQVITITATTDGHNPTYLDPPAPQPRIAVLKGYQPYPPYGGYAPTTGGPPITITDPNGTVIGQFWPRPVHIPTPSSTASWEGC